MRRSVRTCTISLSVAGFYLCASGAALAQVPPAAPNSIPSREQIDIPRGNATAPPSNVRVESNDALARPACALADSDVHVAVTHVRFTGPGGAALPDRIASLLAGIAAPPGDQPIRIVCDVRDGATAVLRKAGYVVAVQIPPQKIAEGELLLEVVTAKLVQVRVLGEPGRYESLLAARAEKLKALYPFNERQAERILLLAGDIPGLDVRLALRPAPSGVVGEVVGDMTVSYRPLVLLANVQNYGSRQLGRETGYVRADFFGLTGAADITSFGISSTLDFSEQQVVQVGHFFGLGSNGVTLGGRATVAYSKPDLDALDLRSRSILGSIELEAPLLRTVDRSVRVSTGLELIEQRTKVYATGGGGVPLNLDRLRVAYARVEGDFSKLRLDGSERYNLATYLELRHGLDILSATKQAMATGPYLPSRPDGDPTATVFRAGADGRVGIGPIFSLAGSAQGQYSHQSLLNFEEYSLGNLTIGRGYDPGANSADSAIALRGEIRARLPFKTTRVEAELFGFYDSVWIWNNETNATDNDRRLASYGGGVRLKLPGLAYLEAMYAHPQDPALNRPNMRPPPDRVLVSLTMQFAPGVR